MIREQTLLKCIRGVHHLMDFVQTALKHLFDLKNLKSRLRVIFSKLKFPLHLCNLQSGNHGDSNTQLNYPAFLFVCVFSMSAFAKTVMLKSSVNCKAFLRARFF